METRVDGANMGIFGFEAADLLGGGGCFERGLFPAPGRPPTLDDRGGGWRGALLPLGGRWGRWGRGGFEAGGWVSSSPPGGGWGVSEGNIDTRSASTIGATSVGEHNTAKTSSPPPLLCGDRGVRTILERPPPLPTCRRGLLPVFGLSTPSPLDSTVRVPTSPPLSLTACDTSGSS